MKEGLYTGENLRKTRPATYREIVRLLACELPARKIARLCRVHYKSVQAVAALQALPIATQKEGLRDMFTRIAIGAGEQIEDALAANKYAPAQLPIVAGVAADKVVSLGLDPNPTTQLTVNVSAPNIIADFRAIAAQIQAACAQLPDPNIIEAEVVPALPAPAAALP